MKRGLLISTLFASLFVIVAATRPARADDASEARRFYEEGNNAYALGEFSDAIAKFKAAFKLKPDAVLLYNIAQAYRLSSDFEQAEFFYKSYLRQSPNAKNRAEVEKRIAEMAEQVQKARAASTAPPTGAIKPDKTEVRPGEPPPKTPPGEGEGEGEGEEEAVGIPVPSESALEAGAGEPGPAPATTDGPAARPIYKKWWFWAGVGAVAVGTAALVIGMSGDDGNAEPSSGLGTTKVF